MRGMDKKGFETLKVQRTPKKGRKVNAKKKDAILDAALEVFAQKGFQDATISEIARKAMVAEATIYEYFENTVELFFDDCRIPVENLIGPGGTGFVTLMKTLHVGRIVWGGYCLGIAQAAFEEALRYARERKTFGKPIAHHQSIEFMLADMAKDIEVAGGYTYQTAALWDQGLKCDYEAAIAKLFSSEMADRVTTKALQIHGGYGFCQEYPVSRFFCDARIGRYIGNYAYSHQPEFGTWRYVICSIRTDNLIFARKEKWIKSPILFRKKIFCCATA